MNGTTRAAGEVTPTVAKARGIAVPLPLLSRAHKVIE
jgi:hypothetical protein